MSIPEKSAKGAPEASFVEVIIFQADDGDCILVRCRKGEACFNVLIDGGRETAVRHLKDYLRPLPLPEKCIDLFVLSHIDADHIEGALLIAKDIELRPLVKEAWFNAAQHCFAAGAVPLGVKQGNQFGKAIREANWAWNACFGGGPIVRETGKACPYIELAENTRIQLLGPTVEALRRLSDKWPVTAETSNDDLRIPGAIALGESPVPDVEQLASVAHSEDRSVVNRSSIAFILEHGSKRLLFAADARSNDLIAALLEACEPIDLRFDLAFLPHHGAEANMSPRLAGMIDTDRWGISSTGARREHPSSQSVARVLKLRPGTRPVELFFNSSHAEAVAWDNKGLKDQYGYATAYPVDKRPWAIVRMNE